jgi:hypothetical protein
LKLQFVVVSVTHDSLTFVWYTNLSAFNKIYYLLGLLPHGQNSTIIDRLSDFIHKGLILHSGLEEVQTELRADFEWALHELVFNSNIHLQPLIALQQSLQQYANRVRAYRDSIIETLDLIARNYATLRLNSVEHQITRYILLAHGVLDPLDYSAIETQAGPRRLIVGPPPDHNLQLEPLNTGPASTQVHDEYHTI